ncbi:sensor domain-containing diguanylate cyclase/phosphohydrolase [Anaerotalea alkaliphila]|uniref:Diguanylate cyclase n=1 Tax=Anaerotalea alkaliphila TaxID=2662126 RepID=A0A7X5HV20_9FIRM|nr:HD domain-containing phosphohydrolase [Anaerotalea alkaliphila]NDL67160.1 diguanylate cyclase [Anaerotalea alkaliphila]
MDGRTNRIINGSNGRHAIKPWYLIPLTILGMGGVFHIQDNWRASMLLPGRVPHWAEALLLLLFATYLLFLLHGLRVKTHLLRQDQEQFSVLYQRLRESERSKSVLLDNLPGMAYRCRLDPSWTMEFVSEGCRNLTGHRPEVFLQNRNLSYADIIHPDHRDAQWDSWSRAVETRQVFQGEYPIITASGEIRWVLEHGQAVYSPQGEVEALEGLVIDITDRVRQEKEARFASRHDMLTGLYNRPYFEEIVEQADKPEQLPLSILIGDFNGLKLVNNALGHGEGDRLLGEVSRILLECCVPPGWVARTGGDEFSILLPRTDGEEAREVLRRIQEACAGYNGQRPAGTSVINLSLGYGTKTFWTESFRDIRKQAEENLYKRKLLEQKSVYSATIASIQATMLERSQETKEHAGRLSKLCLRLGRRFGFSQTQMDDLELFCTLHDIGKIGVDDRILKKPGKLTEEEWVEMRRHPEIGWRIAVSIAELAPVAELILSHHERWDGKGYPRGLAGEDIPLLARILSVVDAYDAMTEDRVYRKALSREEALRELERNAGTQFDPAVVRALVDHVLPEEDAKGGSD